MLRCNCSQDCPWGAHLMRKLGMLVLTPDYMAAGKHHARQKALSLLEASSDSTCGTGCERLSPAPSGKIISSLNHLQDARFIAMAAFARYLLPRIRRFWNLTQISTSDGSVPHSRQRLANFIVLRKVKPVCLSPAAHHQGSVVGNHVRWVCDGGPVYRRPSDRCFCFLASSSSRPAPTLPTARNAQAASLENSAKGETP